MANGRPPQLTPGEPSNLGRAMDKIPTEAPVSVRRYAPTASRSPMCRRARNGVSRKSHAAVLWVFLPPNEAEGTVGLTFPQRTPIMGAKHQPKQQERSLSARMIEGSLPYAECRPRVFL
jgi:hypothetical protein